MAATNDQSSAPRPNAGDLDVLRNILTGEQAEQLEHLTGRVVTIEEKLAATAAELEGTAKSLSDALSSSTEARKSELSETQSGLAQRLNSLESRIQTLEEQIVSLEERVEAHQVAYDSFRIQMEHRLDDLNVTRPDRAELAASFAKLAQALEEIGAEITQANQS